MSGSSQNEHVIAIRRPSAGTRWLVTHLASMTRLLAARLLDKAQPTAHAPLTSHAVTYRIGAGEGPP